MEVELPIRPRGYDIDFAGVVSNIVYVRWLEDLRHTILDEYQPLSVQMERGFCPMLIETHIQYKTAMRIHDKAIGRMWMKDVGKVKWIVAAEILVDDVVAATAEQTGIFITLDEARPIRVPDELRVIYLNWNKSSD